MDLPQPDSPTRHSVSPRAMENETSRTAWSVPRGVARSTVSPATSSSGAAMSVSPARCRDVTDSVAHHVDGEDQDGEGCTWNGDQPEREEHVVLGLGDHQAPGR